MRLCRFGNGNLGVVNGSNIHDVTAALEALPTYRYPLPQFDALNANLDRIAERVRAIQPTTPAIPLANVTLLSPVANPGKIVCAPVNYQKHLDEVRTDVRIHHDNPIAPIHTAGLFLKATSAL